MTKKAQATTVILVIVAFIGIVSAGLHYFAENGQFAPASATGGATKSDQFDPVIKGGEAKK